MKLFFEKEGERYYDFDGTYVYGQSFDEAMERVTKAFENSTVVTAHFDADCGVLINSDGTFLITKVPRAERQ